jgi:hypothetical protein
MKVPHAAANKHDDQQKFKVILLPARVSKATIGEVILSVSNRVSNISSGNSQHEQTQYRRGGGGRQTKQTVKDI